MGHGPSGSIKMSGRGSALQGAADDIHLDPMRIHDEAIEGTARRPEYDGKIVALPRVEVIEAGDILLTSNMVSDDRGGLKQSDVIRRATGGRFSHALVCSSPPVFVEAIGAGVSTLSLGRCFAFDIANVRLLRYPDPAIARRAAQFVQDEIGRDYSIARAVRSVLPLGVLDRIEDRGIFCSALVAQAFVEAGAAPFARTPVDRTTPATIDDLGELIDLTEQAFRMGPIPRNAESMSALDGDRAPTLSARQTALSSTYAKALWPEAAEIIASFPEAALKAQPTVYSILRLVTTAVDRVERVSPNRRAAFSEAIARLDEHLAGLLARGELAALLTEIENADSTAIMVAIEESFAGNPDIDLDAMQGYYRAGREQLADRVKGIANWEEWGLAKSKAMTAYLSIDRAAAIATTRRNDALREILTRNGRKVA